MDKGLGFIRTIQLDWLDAAAAFATTTDDVQALRTSLEPIVGQTLKGETAVRKTIDVLVAIWYKSREGAPDLYEQALQFMRTTQAPADRLWLHYGLATLYYPFFRHCAAAIGQLGQLEDEITRRMVVDRLTADLGALGSLERSAQRVMASLQDWGVLLPGSTRSTYIPAYRSCTTDSADLEAWLLACRLRAEEDRAFPFADLIRLPELYPFKFTLTAGQLRRYPGFEVQRLGIDMDLVRSLPAGR